MTDHQIVRLQVGTSPAKAGQAPMRFYDPSSLLAVSTIEASPRGVWAITDDGRTVLDIHHQDHPQSRDPKGRAGILFMGTGDYLALRKRYGAHLVDGIAGETILLDVPEGLAGRNMPAVVTVRTSTGPLELHDVRVAKPCVEFSRFCLGRGPSSVVDDAVKETLSNLDGGSRGYRSIASAEAVISVGDIVSI